jgi:hypothetical protein
MGAHVKYQIGELHDIQAYSLFRNILYSSALPELGENL